MEVLFVIIIIFALVAIGVKTNNNIAKKPKREYVYAKKAYTMTQHELISNPLDRVNLAEQSRQRWIRQIV